MKDTLMQYATLERSMDQLSMMAELVKKSLGLSIKALFEANRLLAHDVIDMDKSINSFEIDIDNSTFGILACGNTQQDMLRDLVSIQRINPILERIGDHAVNIAESAISLSASIEDTDLLSLPEMAELCKGMFLDSITSFFCKEIDLARDVLGRDEKIDALNLGILESVKCKVMENELSFETALDIIRISKNLERVADLSTNIAEETTYMVIGKNIKHSEQSILQNV